MRKKSKHLIALFVFALILVAVNSWDKARLLAQMDQDNSSWALLAPPPGAGDLGQNSEFKGSDLVIADAFEQRQSGLMLGGEGRVARILPDDNKGSRHQKFLLALDSGQTLLVAHNIDLAPRISNLQTGDRVEFYGVYEWNDKGGVIHWTHHDPKNKRPGGWLKHQGQLYR